METPIKPAWEALAAKALLAALVIAPPRPGALDFELLFLDAEPNQEECRGLSAKGWSPAMLLAWTSEGLRFEHDDALLKWAPLTLLQFVRAASFAFMAAVNQKKPANRIGMN